MADIFDLFKKINKDSAPSQPISWIVAGLGNPGNQYFYTRHNTGFLWMDYLAQKCNTRVDRSKFKALCGEADLARQRVLLMKPQTMMNLSGDAIREAAAFYKIPPEHILIVYDDISLNLGKLRVRPKGTDGGHNGIKSIIYQLQNDQFPRIKVGVGQKPNPDYDLAAWVLSSYNDSEKKTLFGCFETIFKGAELIIQGHIDSAQQLCNSFTSPD